MRNKMTPYSVTLALICMALFAYSSLSGTSLQWQVLSGGGSDGVSPSHKLSSTIGQTSAGEGTSGSHKLIQGFQQNFGSHCDCGDADASGNIDISDAVYLIAYIFGGGPAPNPICQGDADSSGGVDISDAVFLIAYIFGGGPAPSCP